MTDADAEYAKKEIQELVERFTSNQPEFESNGYLESQLRTDFIDELFKALGWDIVNNGQNCFPFSRCKLFYFLRQN